MKSKEKFTMYRKSDPYVYNGETHRFNNVYHDKNGKAYVITKKRKEYLTTENTFIINR